MKRFITVVLTITAVSFLVSLSACSSSSGSGYRGHTAYGVGYGGYYGRRPWGYQPGYIGSGIGPGIGIDDGPVAAQMPEMGRPDFGGMDMDMGMGMDMDMGGFDF